MKTNDTARKWLTRLSLAAGIAFTAHAEFNLAKAMGADPLIAAMLPVAIDAYAMAALRWFKGFDIALSLSLMGAAQIAAHLLDAQLVTVNVTMVVVVSLLVPVSIWRTHALARGDHADSAEVTTPDAEETSESAISRPDRTPLTELDFVPLDWPPAAALEPTPVALLTVADVAKTCGVAEGTVRSWVSRNKLHPTQRDGDGRLLFHPDTVAALN